MTLLNPNGVKEDIFIRLEGEDALPQAQAVLLPLARLAQEGDNTLAQGIKLGIFVPNTLNISEIEAWLPRLSLIAINFPSFSDGRGFSIAKRLRRTGFVNTLRAGGPLITDQFAYAIACGFDEVDIPETVFERQPVEQWLEAYKSVSCTYQRGYVASGNILEQRRAARLKGV
jgi:uncharacterized protein (DUF934 family)